MRKFTDIFIERPVLSIVLSLLILVLGVRSAGLLPILQYPLTQNAVITVTTAYTGADPETIASFITTPLENAIAQANGIDYMTSNSMANQSTIQANLLLNYDGDKAMTEISAQVNSVLNQLPKGSQLPSITIAMGQTIDSMYIGFYSDILPSNRITDYITRVVQPKFQAINGVQSAQIVGARLLALRAWLDPAKLAAYGLTSADVGAALSRNDAVAAAGRTKGNMYTVDLTADTNLRNIEQFKNLVIKADNNTIIRLKDVAKVSLGAQNYNSSVEFNGKQAVYVGLLLAPTANLLSVLDEAKRIYPSVKEQLPEGLSSDIVYDASAYVQSSISEVIRSLLEAFAIVTVVIFLFLGSLRALAIPVIAMPLSLIGAFLIMLLLGYSINLLTLLALVLAIGLVVDDAIIVVENVHRHLEEGKTALKAALIGAAELANPIIAISVVLIAVYVPIGFMGGLTGALFTEFAFTLAGAVGVSAVIALTLTPMMCSKFLKIEKGNWSARIIKKIDAAFEKLRNHYETLLKHSLNYLPVTGIFAIIVLSSNVFLFASSQSELAPQEDQGIILEQMTTAPNATLQQTELYASQINKIFSSFPETQQTFTINGMNGTNGLNSSVGGMILKPWDERKRTSNQLQPLVQKEFDTVTGGKIAAFQLPSLPGGGSGLPIQFVITTTAPFTDLNTVMQNVVQKAWQSGKFIYIDPDLKLDKQQVTLQVDKEKAAELGLTMQDISNVLSTSLSENYINYFDYAGRSYQVIPQVSQISRLNQNEVLNYYIKTSSGGVVPLSTLVKLKSSVVPESLNHFQQLNSTTISAIGMPGVTMGDALAEFQKIAKSTLPDGYSIDYANQSRQYIQEGSALILTFFLALIIIYLSLAAQFESFRDPLIVLISVPMSICGAMIFINLGVGGATLNIYSEVGLVTLIGLISKHGILIVQFANDLQRAGKSKRESIEEAAGVRLRPILMTTAAMVLGVIPLITATGAGALSRYNIGLVIATGISIGTLFTLFVVPAIYMFLAQDHSLHRSELDDDIGEAEPQTP